MTSAPHADVAAVEAELLTRARRAEEAAGITALLDAAQAAEATTSALHVVRELVDVGKEVAEHAMTRIVIRVRHVHAQFLL